jgi:hypothetical protein
MYNRISDYTTPEEFFDNQFANNSAIKDRLYPITLTGTLSEKFDTDFDYVKVMEDNKTEIVKLLKTIEYYKRYWRTEQHDYVNPQNKAIGRHKQTMETIFAFINMYSDTQEEHTKLCNQLLKRNDDYYAMLGNKGDISIVIPQSIKSQGQIDDDVEVMTIDDIEDSEDRGGSILNESPLFPPGKPHLQNKVITNTDRCSLLMPNKDYYPEHMKTLGIDIAKALEDGDIFERKPEVYQRL